jgi:hypothetical protein
LSTLLSRYVSDPRLLTVLVETLDLPTAGGDLPGGQAGRTEEAIAAAARLRVSTLGDIPLGRTMPGLYVLDGKKIDPGLIALREDAARSHAEVADYGQIARLRPCNLRIAEDSAQAIVAGALREIVAVVTGGTEDAGSVAAAAELHCTIGRLAWWAREHAGAADVGDLFQLNVSPESLPPDLRYAWAWACRLPLRPVAAPPAHAAPRAADQRTARLLR